MYISIRLGMSAFQGGAVPKKGTKHCADLLIEYASVDGLSRALTAACLTDAACAGVLN